GACLRRASDARLGIARREDALRLHRGVRRDPVERTAKAVTAFDPSGHRRSGERRRRVVATGPDRNGTVGSDVVRAKCRGSRHVGVPETLLAVAAALEEIRVARSERAVEREVCLATRKGEAQRGIRRHAIVDPGDATGDVGTQVLAADSGIAADARGAAEAGRPGAPARLVDVW